MIGRTVDPLIFKKYLLFQKRRASITFKNVLYISQFFSFYSSRCKYLVDLVSSSINKYELNSYYVSDLYVGAWNTASKVYIELIFKERDR